MKVLRPFEANDRYCTRGSQSFIRSFAALAVSTPPSTPLLVQVYLTFLRFAGIGRSESTNPAVQVKAALEERPLLPSDIFKDKGGDHSGGVTDLVASTSLPSLPFLPAMEHPEVDVAIIGAGESCYSRQKKFNARQTQAK